jgi:hypothetical protein
MGLKSYDLLRFVFHSEDFYLYLEIYEKDDTSISLWLQVYTKAAWKINQKEEVFGYSY